MTSDTTNERHLPDPGKEASRWLQEFCEALYDIARGVEDVVWFDPKNEQQTAKFLDSNQSDQPTVSEYWRRFEIRLLHGKTDAERQAIQNRFKKLTSKRMTGREYIKGTTLELLGFWSVTIDRARDLLKQVINKKDSVFGSPVIAGVAHVIREAMACLLTIHKEGSALRGRWRQTLEITEFDEKDVVEEVLNDAAVFSETLREQDIKSRLDTVADNLHVHFLMTPTDHPSDLITLAVAVQKFDVSRSTLRRAVQDGRLCDYRSIDHVRGAPLLLRESQIAGHFPRTS